MQYKGRLKCLLKEKKHRLNQKIKKTCKFSTAYEAVNTEHKTAKEAGLSKEEAIAFEKKKEVGELLTERTQAL